MIILLPYCDNDHQLALGCLRSIALQARMKLTPEREHVILAAYTGIGEDPLENVDFPDMPYRVHRLLNFGIAPEKHAVNRVLSRMNSALYDIVRSGLSDFRRADEGGVMFCEPDVVFTRLGALDYLHGQFALAVQERCKAGNFVPPILGHLSYDPEVGLYCNGVAVYSVSALDRLAREVEKNAPLHAPFDTAVRDLVLDRLKPTNAIGQINATEEITTEEYLRMMEAPGPVVCWHGVKDQSLLDLVYLDDAERDPLPSPPTIIQRDELPTEKTGAG